MLFGLFLVDNEKELSADGTPNAMKVARSVYARLSLAEEARIAKRRLIIPFGITKQMRRRVPSGCFINQLG